MSYLKKRWKLLLSCTLIFSAVHLYVYFFVQKQQMGYLLYLDLLLLLPAAVWLAADGMRWKAACAKKQYYLGQKELICRLPGRFEHKDIAEHDARILEEELSRRFQENCDLQDYAAKWCHEFKLPLSAVLLMNENISDPDLRQAMREQLERMNRQLSSMLLGCRLQSPLLDLQVKKTSLVQCVKTSVHNHQYFLIRKNFTLNLTVDEVFVYTDPQWLVYILDQILSNAIKYAADRETPPMLTLQSEQNEDAVRLFIEDNGQGIRPQDIGRIFEKGYTGSSQHNGQYASTGLGLYMAASAAEKLGHRIFADSQYGAWTRFTLILQHHPYSAVL